MKPLTLSPDVHSKLRHITASPGQDLSRFPDFLIIGPPRTGTSWLQHHLSCHPLLFLPKEKETYYFSTLGQPGNARFRYPDLTAYLADLRDPPRIFLRKWIGCLLRGPHLYRPRLSGDATASNATLDPEVIREIHLLNPEVKAIMMIRHPLERAWSHAKKDLVLRTGRPAESVPLKEYDKFFRAAGQAEKARYPDMIRNWRDILAPDHLFLGDFRRIATSPAELIAELHAFLDVPTGPGHTDTARLDQRINPTTGEGIPAPVREVMERRFADAVTEYETVIRETFDPS